MKTISMIGNAHLDPVWLWQWQEGRHEIKATFQAALDRLNETPGFVFTCATSSIGGYRYRYKYRYNRKYKYRYYNRYYSQNYEETK